MKLIKEQELIIEILKKIDRTIHPGAKKREDEEFRITEELKKSIPTSEGLKDAIQSVQGRYAWSSGKKIFKIVVAVFVMLLTLTFSGFDMFTDGNFSEEVKQPGIQANETACEINFNSAFTKANMNCNSDLQIKMEDCQKALVESLKILNSNECAVNMTR